MRRILRGQVFNIVLLFILCFGFSSYNDAQAQVSGTYTINSAVATGGTNFQSFNDAVTYMQSGLNGPIVFNVVAGSGPYNEQVYLNNKIGTTAANTLTFNCNGVTLKFLSTNDVSRAGVKLDNISYVTFDNLTITPLAANDGEYGYGFHLLNNSDNNVIKNCHIINPTNGSTPNNNEGIVINGANTYSTDDGTSFCDNNTIQNNTISGGGNGITLNSSPVSGAATYMQGNKILNNTITDAYNSCIQLIYTDGTIVDGNDLQGGPDAYNTVAGVYMNLYDKNVQVINNKIHNFHIDPSFGPSSIYGIMNSAQGAANNVNLIANNLIYDFSSNDAEYGIASRFGLGSFFNVYHNTIAIDDQTDQGSTTDGIYFANVSDVNVMDNIITVTRYTMFGNSCFTLETFMPRLISNRNVFYVKGSDGYNAIGYIFLGPGDMDDLPTWQKLTGYDYHGINVDPLYANPAGFQYQPTAQSIDNMGVYLNVNKDITGAARSTTSPDPGCYEFTSAACSSSITGGTTFVLPDSVLCYGPMEYFGLSGNTAGNGQTYTWQTSSTAGGTYSNVTSAQPWPAYDVVPTTTLYYRVAVTCSGTTKYSTPVRVIVNNMLPAGTYTINSTQATGGINFNSFGDAVLAMQCGIAGPVVFNVAPNTGPYNEQVILRGIGTSASKTITFNGNGDTVTFASKFSDESANFKIDGVDYVTVDSLNFNVKGGSWGFGVQLINDADHNTIKRCTVVLSKTTTASSYAGIVISPSPSQPTNVSKGSFCDTNTIAKNTIIGGYYGITCTSGSSTLPSGNSITNNTIKDAAGGGIILDGVINTLVDSNDISQPTRKVFDKFYSITVQQSNTSTAVTNVKITGNRIHDLLQNKQDTIIEIHGVHFEKVAATAASPNIVSNNLVYNFYGKGIQYGLYALSSSYLKFYHNTISLEDSTAKITDPALWTRGFGVFGNTPSTGMEFKNNSIVITRGGTALRTGIFLNFVDPVVCDNNNYLIKAATGTNITGSMNATNYPLLSDWKGTGKDANSISNDPLYKDPLNGDFTPTYLPFDDKGTPVGIPLDILDSTRSTTKPDIGAFEFTICYPLSTPVLTLDSVGVYSIRFAWTPVTNTTGYLVSRDGINWGVPTSGSMGTTHLVTGLKARDTVSLIVKALGTRWDCPPVYSQWVKGQTITDQIFIPNTFTPNGNGQNDVFKVYSNIVQTMHLMVYNQWGEKVFETTDIKTGWDGTYKGKPAPIGVYVYVAAMVLTDNSSITKKGTFNLIR